LQKERPWHIRIVWVDIPVVDLERAIRFYSAILGGEVMRQEFQGLSIAILPPQDGAMGGCEGKCVTRACTQGIQALWMGVLLMLAAGLSAGCTHAAVGQRTTASIGAPQDARVVLVLARGGLGDQAFNDSAQAGLQRTQRELGVRVQALAFAEGDAQLATLRQLARRDDDLIIALGAENAPALRIAAREFPSTRFAIIDAAVESPNVTSIVFRELEGDFLAGALAALLSRSGTVGFFGGADVPVIRRIEHGWRQGVLYVNPRAEILTAYVGGKGDFGGFANPTSGETLTAQLYARGAEVVYAAAGRTTLGAIAAARSHRRLIITTGSDQRRIAPGGFERSGHKEVIPALLHLAERLVLGRGCDLTLKGQMGQEAHGQTSGC
jgi:basic membrane protein A